MRVIVVGLGIQGHKRRAIAGKDVIGVVDPVNPNADYKNIKEVPLDKYDAALVCTPDQPKFELLHYLLSNKKHVLVEKPLLTENQNQLVELQQLAEKNKTTAYTAYNHRFEPHFINLKKCIESGILGKIHMAKFFYGNGTARDVRNSVWRDKGDGVLPDLGSHLLDTANFLFGDLRNREFKPLSFDCFENKSYDHVHFGTRDSSPSLFFEATLLSWRNTFHADVYAENGSAHIECLCKWGPSTFTVRKRVLPSGRPPEEVQTLTQSDPTWALEYDHFKILCKTGTSNIQNDEWINATLTKLSKFKS
ncbi:MAG: Gfo/Idh/MocA family oxidoreductase [Oligoflexia bacterium]|nr:Gfo/Idh/MocA family oxidoreductase [Oligoflexia bacterium]